MKLCQLRAQCGSRIQQRDHDSSNERHIGDQFTHALFEGGGANRANLQAKVTQLAAQVILDVVDLTLEEFARGEEQTPLLTGWRFDMNNLEEANPHHLSNAECIVAVRLVDPSGERSMHMAGLDTDRREPCIDQPRVDPR